MDSLVSVAVSNEIYTFQQPRKQEFRLPFPIIKYIFTNPSSHRAWRKLIKTCKFFFAKNQMYPIRSVKAVKDGKWNIDGVIFDISNSVLKLWLCNNMHLSYNCIVLNNDIVSSLIPKIYKSELRYLQLSGQTLTWNEYHFLTSSGTIEIFYYWRNMTVKYSDGTFVTCDKLIENLRNVKEIEINCSNNPSLFKPNTVKKINQLLSDLTNITHFNLTMLSECFDFSSFTYFLMDNKNVNRVYLNFEHISESYKRMLEEYIDKTIANPCTVIPFIWYPGFEGDRFQKYKCLYQRM